MVAEAAPRATMSQQVWDRAAEVRNAAVLHEAGHIVAAVLSGFSFAVCYALGEDPAGSVGGELVGLVAQSDRPLHEERRLRAVIARAGAFAGGEDWQTASETDRQAVARLCPEGWPSWTWADKVDRDTAALCRSERFLRAWRAAVVELDRRGSLSGTEAAAIVGAVGVP